MAYYRCTICDAKGKKYERLIQAGSRAELLEAYAGKNDFLLFYEETNAVTTQDRIVFKRQKHFSRELVREFTGIMSALLASGNTIASSLELCGSIGGAGMGKSGSGTKLGELCALLLAGIRKGERFSGCLLRSSPSFSPLYVALVGIGEKTGSTAEVFKRLTIYLATSKKIRTKVEGTLFYPAFVLVSALAGSVLVLLFVMPRMAEIFSIFDTEGNAIDISGMYISIYLLFGSILCLGASIFVLAAFHRNSRRAALIIDNIILQLPFIGVFFKAMESLDFCFALELCSRTGMNIAVSLKEAQKVLRNRAYASAVGEVQQAAAAGYSLSQAFLTRTLFPPVIGQWISVGERTGEAEMVFAHLKDFFMETVDTFTERFLNSLEPVLILITGLVVLLLVLQFVLPLFNLYGAVL